MADSEARLAAVEARQAATREQIAAAEKDVKKKEAAFEARLKALDERLAGKVAEEVGAGRAEARDAMRSVLTALAREEDRRATIEAANELRALRDEGVWRAELLETYRQAAAQAAALEDASADKMTELQQRFDAALASTSPAAAELEAGLEKLHAELRSTLGRLENEVQQRTATLEEESAKMRAARAEGTAREERTIRQLSQDMGDALTSYGKQIEARAPTLASLLWPRPRAARGPGVPLAPGVRA